jgi:predicted nucleotidyltransferase
VSLPDFAHTGDLPTGIHTASLPEVLFRFGKGSARRKFLSLRLHRIHRLAVQTGHLARFVVFGSFVTDKLDPNDVDVFMIMDDNFQVGRLSGELRRLFDHSAAQIHFGCSVFWVRRLAALGGEQATIEHWQIKRDGTKRGIVEIEVD